MINLKTFDGAVISPEDDSAILKTLMPDGIISGCDFSKSEDNKIHITDGYIVFKGRNIQIVNEVINAKLATEGTVDGCVYLKLDLNNHNYPAILENKIAKQDFDDNEMLLATYKATATGILDLKRVGETNKGGYFVGDIYTTFSEVSPAERFGGTWEKIKERMLFGASENNSVGNTGGSKTVSLTEKQNGRHNHHPEGLQKFLGDSSSYDSKFGWHATSENIASGYRASPIEMSESGKGEPHENMPPYLSVYIWKRVA